MSEEFIVSEEFLDWAFRIFDQDPPLPPEIEALPDEVIMQGFVEFPPIDHQIDIDIFDVEAMTELVMGFSRAWLAKSKKPINPDRLPYDPREGF